MNLTIAFCVYPLLAPTMLVQQTISIKDLNS